jgi:hypothetical protein
MTMPIDVSENVYDKSTWAKSYTFMGDDYVDADNPGTPLNLLPYEIKWEGRLREFATGTYFSYTKPADEAGTEGVTVSGADNNVLNLALDSDDTASFRGRVIISDIKFVLNDEVQYTLRITFNNRAGVTE